MSVRDDIAFRAHLLVGAGVLLATLAVTKFLKIHYASTTAGFFAAWMLAAAFALAVATAGAHRRWGETGRWGIGILAAAVTLAAAVLVPKPFLAAAHAIKADVAFVVFLVLGLDLVLRVPSAAVRQVSRVLLSPLLLLLIALAALELGLFAATGSEAGWYELWFLVGNPVATAGIVSEYAGWKSFSWLLIPAGAAMASVVASRLARRRARPPLTRPLATPWTAAATAVLILALFAAPEPPMEPALVARTEGNSLVRLLRHLPHRATAVNASTGSAPAYRVPRTELVPGPGSEPVSVLFVILESVRADLTTPYAPDLPTTPFLARMASDSLVVEQMYPVIPFSSKSVTPMFCGVYPRVRMALELAGERLPHTTTCLPELLARAGYRTAAFTTFCRTRDSCRGMGDVFDFEARLSEVGFRRVVGQEDLDAPDQPSLFPWGLPEEAMLPPIGEWLASLPADVPFVMAAWTTSTHMPFPVPEAFDDRLPPRSDLGARIPTPRLGMAPGSEMDYLRALSYVDDFVGRLIRLLQAAGRADSTLVVVVGDHGIGFGEHGRHFYERVLYEEGIRVPAIIAGPGVSPASVPGPRQHIDLLPTLVELLDLQLVEGALPPHGRSLLEPPPGDRKLFFSCFSEGRCMALRRGDRKYHYFYRYQPMQVFDLRTDPGERHDLAPRLDPANLAAVERELLAWRRSVNEFYERGH